MLSVGTHRLGNEPPWSPALSYVQEGQNYVQHFPVHLSRSNQCRSSCLWARWIAQAILSIQSVPPMPQEHTTAQSWLPQQKWSMAHPAADWALADLAICWNVMADLRSDLERNLGFRGNGNTPRDLHRAGMHSQDTVQINLHITRCWSLKLHRCTKLKVLNHSFIHICSFFVGKGIIAILYLGTLFFFGVHSP